MITSARFFAWFLASVAALMVVTAASYVVSGTPDFRFNGVLVSESGEAGRVLAEALAFLALGVGMAAVLQPTVLSRYARLRPFVSWLESLPTDHPKQHLRFYVGTASLAIPVVLLAPSPPIPARVLIVLSLPILSGIGWLAIWFVLGFHLINPFVYFFPVILRIGARFFHFFSVVGAGTSVLWLPLSHPQQAEVGMSAAIGAGAAAGAAHFLQFWNRRQGATAA